MARRPRLHVPDGLYLVELRANAEERLFVDDEDFRSFEALLAESKRWAKCSVHAFCMLESTVMIGAQINSAPVGGFVQRLTSRYAKYANRKRCRSGHLFASHFRSIVVQRSKYLLDLVRFIHRAPLRAGVTDDMDEYRWSSHRAYAAIDDPGWLTMFVAKEMLRNRGRDGVLGYLDWVRTKDSGAFADSVVAEMRGGLHIVGDQRFRQRVLTSPESAAVRPTLEEIVLRVAGERGVDLQSLVLPSRRREHVLARALIAWEATRSGVATLSAVAKRLRRDPSTLLSAIERYRNEAPELFLSYADEVEGEGEM